MRKLTDFYSKYSDYYYDETNQVLLFVYNTSTEKMLLEDFKTHLNILIEIPQKYQVKGVLVDSRDMLFSVDPQLQEQAVKTIVPIWENLGITKYAQVLSQNFFVNLAGKQIIEDAYEKMNSKIESRFFENLEEAQHWLAGVSL